MPLVRLSVPLADVQRDPSLDRIIERLKSGQHPDADIIALAKRLRGELNIEVVST